MRSIEAINEAASLWFLSVGGGHCAVVMEYALPAEPPLQSPKAKQLLAEALAIPMVLMLGISLPFPFYGW
jgi:hypothetical protein